MKTSFSFPSVHVSLLGPLALPYWSSGHAGVEEEEDLIHLGLLKLSLVRIQAKPQGSICNFRIQVQE